MYPSYYGPSAERAIGPSPNASKMKAHHAMWVIHHNSSMVYTIWMFPKIVVPPNHPFYIIRFSIVNHPFWDTPILSYFWKHPWFIRGFHFLRMEKNQKTQRINWGVPTCLHDDVLLRSLGARYPCDQEIPRGRTRIAKCIKDQVFCSTSFFMLERPASNALHLAGRFPSSGIDSLDIYICLQCFTIL